jgi:GlpG protein
MIQVAEIYSASQARVFADYCQSRGWDVSLVTLEAQLIALYSAEECAAEVLNALAEFAATPDAEQYQAAAWQHGEPLQQKMDLGLAQLWSQMRGAAGLWTQVVAYLCVLVFLLQQIWPDSSYQALKFFGAAQWQQSWFDWRWLSPVLLHFSLAHLLFNLLAWWLFAGRIEQQLGARSLMLMSVSAALLSNCAQFLLQGEHFGGLSGVVYAVLGFLWIYGWRFPAQSLRLSRWDIGLALFFLALGFMDLLWVNTANWAHLSGLLAGMAFGLLQSSTQSPTQSPTSAERR